MCVCVFVNNNNRLLVFEKRMLSYLHLRQEELFGERKFKKIPCIIYKWRGGVQVDYSPFKWRILCGVLNGSIKPNHVYSHRESKQCSLRTLRAKFSRPLSGALLLQMALLQGNWIVYFKKKKAWRSSKTHSTCQLKLRGSKVYMLSLFSVEKECFQVVFGKCALLN